MTLTMRKLYDMFKFYPDEIHYYSHKENEEDYIINPAGMEEFVEIFGDSPVE